MIIDHRPNPAPFSVVGTKTLVAVRLFRKMRGGSLASLIECDDGYLYIVKTTNNPQGPNTLANEMLGSVVARAVGLPVADFSTVYISDAFLEQSPGMFLATTEKRYHPVSGTYYGSQLVGRTPSTRGRFGFLALSQAWALLNRTDFLGMYLLDIWAKHQFYHQAVFFGNYTPQGLKAFFIDHGSMFGGPNWSGQERKFDACYPPVSLYSGLSSYSREVNSWLQRFNESIPETLAATIPIVPKSWFTGDIHSLHNLLLERLKNLPTLVEQHFLFDVKRESLHQRELSRSDGVRWGERGASGA